MNPKKIATPKLIQEIIKAFLEDFSDETDSL